MDKMIAVTKLADLRRDLSKAQQMDDFQNEGGEGYESAESIHAAISAHIAAMAASKLCFANCKIHDAADWADVRAAWNAAIQTNMSKGQATMLAAASAATGYEFRHISQLKAFFA
jgi:hypothetical protein